MIAATSLVVSSSIFLRRKSTQCHWHEGNVFPNAHRAHDAYGERYAPGMSGPSACLKLDPRTGSTPPVLPWNPPQNPITSVCPVRDFASRSAASNRALDFGPGIWRRRKVCVTNVSDGRNGE